MDLKKTKAPDSVITRDMNQMSEELGNVYELVNILGKRANQISAEIKGELEKKLQEYSSSSDNLEEVFENREQIAISKYYEKLPKPTLMAIQEFDDNKIYYRNPTEIAE
ncbi:MAG: DNA-directed RNA polymerase subunit omega [Paludibacteraceae bacterium]|jgi:DNA-directed RNA polymerase subunit K/omega|nr:DNA-directed RNA polymerase subunit omega [Paludibacteraceae bacterium]